MCTTRRTAGESMPSPKAIVETTMTLRLVRKAASTALLFCRPARYGKKVAPAAVPGAASFSCRRSTTRSSASLRRCSYTIALPSGLAAAAQSSKVLRSWKARSAGTGRTRDLGPFQEKRGGRSSTRKARLDRKKGCRKTRDPGVAYLCYQLAISHG